MFQLHCDLHLHSVHSDGRYEPSRLVRILSSRGVKVAALTDHDTMWGFPRFFEKCLEIRIFVLSGIELTTWLDVGGKGEEVHLLGYGLRWSEDLENDLRALKRERDDHQKRVVEKVASIGYRLDFERVAKRAGSDPVMVSHVLLEYLLSRPLFGASLILTGKLRRWVDKFLKEVTGAGGLAYIPPPKPFEEGVKFIRKHGGLAVLAHPVKIEDSRVRDEALASDIDGVEVFYPGQESIQEDLCTSAKKRGLIITGGSDWHGYFSGAYPGWRLPVDEVNALLIRLELPRLAP